MGQISLGRAPTRRKTEYIVRAAPIMRPEPNYEKLARALWSLAELIREGEPRQEGAPDESSS